MSQVGPAFEGKRRGAVGRTGAHPSLLSTVSPFPWLCCAKPTTATAIHMNSLNVLIGVPGRCHSILQVGVAGGEGDWIPLAQPLPRVELGFESQFWMTLEFPLTVVP